MSEFEKLVNLCMVRLNVYVDGSFHPGSSLLSMDLCVYGVKFLFMMSKDDVRGVLVVLELKQKKKRISFSFESLDHVVSTIRRWISLHSSYKDWQRKLSDLFIDSGIGFLDNESSDFKRDDDYMSVKLQLNNTYSVFEIRIYEDFSSGNFFELKDIPGSFTKLGDGDIDFQNIVNKVAMIMKKLGVSESVSPTDTGMGSNTAKWQSELIKKFEDMGISVLNDDVHRLPKSENDMEIILMFKQKKYNFNIRFDQTGHEKNYFVLPSIGDTWTELGVNLDYFNIVQRVKGFLEMDAGRMDSSQDRLSSGSNQYENKLKIYEAVVDILICIHSNKNLQDSSSVMDWLKNLQQNLNKIK